MEFRPKLKSNQCGVYASLGVKRMSLGSMVVSSSPRWPPARICIYGVFRGFTCFVFQRCVEAQFASSRFPCALLLPLLPPFFGLASTLVLVSISTDSISVTVPGGCRSQGCHGYLHALRESCLAPPYQGTFPKLIYW